jgi:glycosyltransferase involved in cell wall biosynthesis
MLGTWTNCIDVMIAPSRFLRDKLIEGGLPPDMIVVKPNFVYPDPGPGPGDGNYALFVGRLAPEKGVDTLIEAWKMLGSDVPLRILGDGPMADAVARSAREVSGISWLGLRSRAEVLEAMGRARCVIVPSHWYEVVPSVILEAFATGTPPVVSDLGAPADIVAELETGLRFQPGDANDLARQLLRMFDGSIDVASMRRRARAEYEAKYSASANYEALLAIYSMAAERRRSRR